jgi:hypothetical protein
MITIDTATSSQHGQRLHYGDCSNTSASDKTNPSVRFRVNGACKRWKRSPEKFKLPIKHGLYGPCGYVTQDNAQAFHWASMCPLNDSF